VSPPGFEPGTKGLKVRARRSHEMSGAVISGVSALTMCLDVSPNVRGVATRIATRPSLSLLSSEAVCAPNKRIADSLGVAQMLGQQSLRVRGRVHGTL
jgi:hypothetical protein